MNRYQTKKVTRRLTGLLALLFLLSFAACTPPTDITAGFDESGKEIQPKDESPLAADRHKDPNAPQQVEWAREKMLHFQGYYYFLQGGSISPTSIDNILIELGRIPSTVPPEDIPTERLQTNCGFVGYTVYRNEDQPQYLYIMDNSTFHVLESPQQIKKGYDMPRYIRCDGTLFAVSSTVREYPLPDYTQNYTQVGVIDAEGAADQIPYDDLTTNCGFVGCRVYVSPQTMDGGYIALKDGYVTFNLPMITRPSIRYHGALYFNDGKSSSVIASNYQRVGAVLGTVPPSLHATEDFYCNFDSAIGCAIYASNVDPGTIYLLFDGLYYPYSLSP
ncbi:MAG: hypothetical protein IJW40_10100 [Clostridia bacterium]|nr:hypothetical protein [Clostridia bacterium]